VALKDAFWRPLINDGKKKADTYGVQLSFRMMYITWALCIPNQDLVSLLVQVHRITNHLHYVVDIQKIYSGVKWKLQISKAESLQFLFRRARYRKANTWTSEYRIGICQPHGTVYASMYILQCLFS
jgi:hypothetical protein